ncbi:hypothetical protein D1970_12865 [Mesobacillus zeae]|uniref:Uncharacterized protein n=1 Tax=Mesobacillus zeae TaxID=1917180 RepID=A0A398B383_9BACI|nr:hypothetical protein D1970_12865 [Mesobacillus zeae]
MNNLEIVIYSRKSHRCRIRYKYIAQPVRAYYVIHLKDIKNKKALILNKNIKGRTYLKIFETLYF